MVGIEQKNLQTATSGSKEEHQSTHQRQCRYRQEALLVGHSLHSHGGFVTVLEAVPRRVRGPN